MSREVYQVYFAGELFSLKHLLGNAALADAIHAASEGAFSCVLPQALEQRDTTAQGIRDQDIETLLSCDVGVFNFDGDEVDSGTVVEYMIAKFIDMPTVIVRTDFRSGGDQAVDPWNLMLSFYPRTKVLCYDGMGLYQRSLGKVRISDNLAEVAKQSVAASQVAIQEVAGDVVSWLRAMINEPARLKGVERDAVMSWVRKMPGEIFAGNFSESRLKDVLAGKIAKGVL